MMCCCEKCKFVFESIRLLDRCPDCGFGPVREATDEEVNEYAENRKEYGLCDRGRSGIVMPGRRAL